MDVFDQWEGDRQQPPRALGPNPFDNSPNNSPNRTQAAARRRPSSAGPGGADGLLGTEPHHAADVFSLRRIDLPATVLGGAAAVPTPRSARGLVAAASQAPAMVRTILHAVVQSHVLVLGMSDGCVVRWALDGSREPETIPILPSASAAAATTTPRSAGSLLGLGGGSSSSTASTTTSSSAGEEIRKLFLDPTGNHLVVASTAAEYYYLHARAARPRRLAKWQGLVVESIAFDRAYGGEASTKAILLGTDRGQIHETALDYSSSGSATTPGGGSASASSASAAALMGGGGGGGGEKERPVVKVHELEQPLPIRALEFELLRDGPLDAATAEPTGTTGGAGGRLLLVLAATSNPVRLYKFLGGPAFEALFARYRDGLGSLTFQDFGGSPQFTAAELHLYRKSPGGKAESLALTTEAGIFNGKLTLSPPPSSTDPLITEATLTEYLSSDGRSLLLPSTASGVRSPPRPRGGASAGDGGQPWPLSLALSEFHFLLLYPRRLQVVSRLSGRQVQHNPLPLEEGLGLGRLGRLLFDSVQGTYWLFAERALFQVALAREEEGRFVWRLYLEKALQGDTRKFDLAYQHARDARSRAAVDGAQAAYYFKRGQYELAARCYARLLVQPLTSSPLSPSSNSFEEVALKFVETGTADGEAGLRVFLLERLALLGGGGGAVGLEDGGGGVRARFKTQRVMLCTWLMELYLKRLAALAPSDTDDAASTAAAASKQEEEYDATVEELRAFLQTHIEDLRLHPPTTYELLASHGRKQEMLLYATLIEDVERVVALYLQDHDAARALAALDAAPLERVEPLYYRHAHVLLLHAPAAALASFLRKTPGLDPARLLPAIVNLIATCDATLAAPAATGAGKAQAAEARQAAVRYLEHCVSVEGGLGLGVEGEEGLGGVHGGRGAVGSLGVGMGGGGPKPSSSGGGGGAAPAVLYNYLLQLYAQAAAAAGAADGSAGQEAAAAADERLLAFLQAHTNTATGGMLDLAGALRVCARHGRTRACVHLYACMGMHEEAVALALRSGDVTLAKEHADMPPLGSSGVASPHHHQQHGLGYHHAEDGGGGEGGAGEALRKRLWLMVARHLIEVKKIRVPEALSLLEECPLLHIEDLLPHLPDLASIDDVRDRVCHALVRYSDTIKSLKAEMAETRQSAAEVEHALQELQHRHLPFTHAQRCALCAAPAMASQFYLFPCRHAFHADCLVAHVLPQLGPAPRRAVHDLREQLTAELAALGLSSVPPPSTTTSGSGDGKVSRRKAAQLEALQSEIDGCLAAECPLCGDLIIRTVGAPLLSEEEEARGDARAWALD